MTTPTHDPLTPEHLALLEEAPFEISVNEQKADKYKSVHFLHQLGYLAGERTHISETAGNHRWRWTRTSKPLP